MFFKFSRLFLSTLTSLKPQMTTDRLSVKRAHESEFGWFRDPSVKCTVYTNKAPSNGLRRGRPVKLAP